MNTRLLALALGAIFTISGCIPSVNPVYTTETLIFDESIVGTWTDDRKSQTWRFEQLHDKSYRLTYTDQAGQTGRFVAHLADIQGVKFLDLFPEPDQEKSFSFYKFHLVPIHTVYLVQPQEDGMQVAAVDFGWLEKYLESHPGEVNQTVFGDRRLITAATEDLQNFVVKHKQHFTSTFDLKKVDEKKLAIQ